MRAGIGLAKAAAAPHASTPAHPPRLPSPHFLHRPLAASVLWLPYQAYTLLLRPVRSASADGEAGAAGAAGAASDVASASPLGDTSLLLLLALVFHAPPQDAPFGNPYRQALGRLQDADDLGALAAGRQAATH